MKTLAEIGVHGIDDVKNATEDGSSYVLSSIFNTKNKVSRGLLKRKMKIVKGIEPFLLRVIKDDEKVYYVSYGVKNSTFDHLFLGAIAHYINRKIFVFTTKWILMIKYKGKYTPSQLYGEIPYQHIVKVKSTIFANMQLFFSNGNKNLFVGIPKADRRFINDIFSKFNGKAAAGQEAGGVLNLCPHCFERVDGFPKQCGACRGKFKSPKTTALLSLLFPGIGDIYLGHKGFGLLQAIAGAFVWIGFLVPQPATATSAASAPSMVGAIIIFALMHGIDAAVTMNTAGKGIYPA
jgi:hypothetical protein